MDKGFHERAISSTWGVEQSIVEKAGSWFSYSGERLGQGREKRARAFLKENTSVRDRIDTAIRQKLALGDAQGKPASSEPSTTANAGYRIVASFTMRACGLFSFLTLAAGAAFAQSGFDIVSLNRTADPCGNFFQYACGGWMKANPIPSDVSIWGSFNALQERNRTLLQSILETASTDQPNRSAIDQKIGDFYSACMNDAVLNTPSMDTFQRDLNRIAVVDNKSALPELIVMMYRLGAPPFFRFSSEQDAKDSTQMIADVDQGGLGLPDRDYYLKTDEKSAETRKQYHEHLIRMFELLGRDAAVAQKSADAVLAIETERSREGVARSRFAP